MEKKKQHLIPNCYLKAWCDPITPPGHTRAIWRISKDGSTKKQKSPEKSFTSTDRYTITLPNGERSLALEDTLSSLEAQFTSVLSRVRRRDSLSALDRARLCMFAAAMHARTMAQGEHWRGEMAKMHEQLEMMEQSIGIAPNKSLATAKMVKTAHTDIVIMSIMRETPLLFQMNMSVVVTDDPTGFITSDVPCIWHNPKLHPGLAQRDIEVLLPLTPQHTLLISHQNLETYVYASSQLVREANRNMRFSCYEEFVSWKGIVDPFWFSEREMPEDAWERTEQGKAAIAEAGETQDAVKPDEDGE
jgi:hypothetical protein